MITFIEFQQDLARAVSELLEGIETRTAGGDPAYGVRAFCQELPDISKIEEAPFPFALVRVYNGHTEEELRIGETSYEGFWDVTAEIQLGIHWPDPLNQGHVKLLEMIQRIVDRFVSDRLLYDKYTAMQNIDWAVQDSDEVTPPYYFGGVIIHFWVPKVPYTGQAIYC